AICRGFVPLRIELRGANRSYLNTVLGIPPRVKLFVDGHEHHYAPESWMEEGGALIYEAKIIPVDVELMPVPVSPTPRYVPIQIGPGLNLKLTVLDDGTPIYVAGPAAAPSLPTPDATGSGSIVVDHRIPSLGTHAAGAQPTLPADVLEA